MKSLINGLGSGFGRAFGRIIAYFVIGYIIYLLLKTFDIDKLYQNYKGYRFDIEPLDRYTYRNNLLNHNNY